MKFVMLTYTGPDQIARWEQMSDEQRQALVGEHMDWFARHADRITGGAELAYPPKAAELVGTTDGLSVTDGPFPETKELLGGFIEIEADSLEVAKQMASEWPNLRTNGNRVVVSAIVEPRDLGPS